MEAETHLLLRFGVALFIGILVGLQREFASDEPGHELSAGARTFAFFSLIGCMAAMIAEQLSSPWVFAIIVFLPGIFLAINYYFDVSRERGGMTTETAAVLTMLAGALVYWNHISLAVALGVTITVLLSIKFEMREFVRHITREDVFSTLKFAVITAIILPVLPNRTFGPPPFDVFNPFKIWLLVVLISGISFAGYILMKIVGPRKGIGLTGFLGGLASSTAVTLSFSQRSRDHAALAKSFALAIIIAWTVMFARLLIEVAAVNPSLARHLWLPVLISIVAGLLYVVYLWRKERGGGPHGDVSFSNPFELLPAITFGLLFALILFVAKAAQMYLGTTGIYLTSVVSAIADVDAIALTVAELHRTADGPDTVTSARAIMLAGASNTLAKGLIVAASASPALRRAILPGTILMIVAGLLAVFVISP